MAFFTILKFSTYFCNKLESGFTQEESRKKNNLFIILAGFFITNAVVAEFIGTKIFSWEKTLGLPPLDLNLFGDKFSLNMTAGVILWPIVFIMTDLINEYYGKKGVKKLSYLAAMLLVYAFVMVFVSIKLKGADWWLGSQSPVGINNMEYAFSAVFGQGLAIIVGSLLAFLIGQVADAYIFEVVKRKTGHNKVWLRATGSTIVSQLIDSFVVLFVAFYVGIKLGPNPEKAWSLKLVLQVGLLNYMYKFLMAIILLPLLYFVHRLVDNYLGKSLSIKMQNQTVLAEEEQG